MGTVSIIIPTLNEGAGIEYVLDDIPHEELSSMGHRTEVVVVDGGSSDGTRERAVDKGARVVVKDGGKAEAVRKGLEVSGGEIVFIIDGDGSYPADRIVDMVMELEEGASMVIGSRFSGNIHDGAMTLRNRIGNRLLTWLADELYPSKVTDVCSGLRGFRRDVLDGVDVPGKGFEIEAALHSIFSSESMVEIPIDYKERRGESKLSMSDGLHIARRLIWERLKK